jgi:hypothetical protein
MKHFCDFRINCETKQQRKKYFNHLSTQTRLRNPSLIIIIIIIIIFIKVVVAETLQ